MKILLISTTTHSDNSTSRRILSVISNYLESRGHHILYINAADLHIVDNQSCYAGGKSNCASYEAGKYRCWAHKLSHDNPEEFGGADQMGDIYDGIESADVVIFSTSVRWESHSALLQKIIERMTTLQNRHTVYGEPNPLLHKKCGVIVTGHNSKAQSVASHLLNVLQWIGFDTNIYRQIVWQNNTNLHSEVSDKTDIHTLRSQIDRLPISEFIEALNL